MTKEERLKHKYGIPQEIDYKFVSYAIDVQEGNIIACDAIKKSTERYLSWFGRDDIYFSQKRAQRTVSFISKTRHTESPFTNQPFILSEWQKYVVYSVYGWIRKDTNLRAIRTVFLMIPRKSGKTSLASALSLYNTMADGEMGAECYFLAPTREQAKQALKYTQQYAATINKGNILKINRNEVRFDWTKSTLKTLSGDASVQDGYNPSFALLDEVHIYEDSSLVDIMTSGMGMRSQPLIFQVTTAGFNLNGYCYNYYKMCKQVLDGIIQDDTLQPIIYELDENDDWHDSKVWAKASPALGDTIRIEAFQAEYEKACNMKSQEVNFKTKFLNVWCQSKNVWIPNDIVEKCMPKSFTIDDMLQYSTSYLYLGLDLASTQDLTALSAFGYIKELDKYFLKSWMFIPSETVKTSPNSQLYKEWIRDGYLIEIEGNVTDYNYVQHVIEELDKKINIQKIVYDSWNATQLICQLQEIGLGCVLQPMSQSTGSFSPYTKAFERMLLMAKVLIDYNPCFLWCLSNVEIKEDWAQNQKPVKSHIDKKIDPVISSIEALAGYLFDSNITAADFTPIQNSSESST